MVLCKSCRRRAYYGFKGTKLKLFCHSHMDRKIHISLDRNYCLHCPITASYGFPGTKKRLYCNSHKTEGCINLANVKKLNSTINTKNI
jgi:hypothetical protein